MLAIRTAVYSCPLYVSTSCIFSIAFFAFFPMREGTAVLLYLAWILRPKMPVVLNHIPIVWGFHLWHANGGSFGCCVRTVSRASSFISTLKQLWYDLSAQPTYSTPKNITSACASRLVVLALWFSIDWAQVRIFLVCEQFLLAVYILHKTITLFIIELPKWQNS